MDEQNLADRAIGEFTNLASGLLQAATLLGLSEIRKNSRKILSNFGSELDPGFLTHLAMLRPREDAGAHVVPLLVAEIEAVLEDALQKPLLSNALLKDWCQNHFEPGDHLDTVFGKTGLDHRSIAESLCVDGFAAAVKANSDIPNPNNGTRKLARAAAILLPADTSQSNAKFSRLMANRTFYQDAPRSLQLGTIVFSAAFNAYYLCLQPVCDSVRLTKAQVFVFIELKRSVSVDGHPVSHVVTDASGDLLELTFSPKANQCFTASFEPEKGKGQVMSRVQDDGIGYIFIDSDKREFSWVDQLKPAHAQRAVERFASDLSRVGLTESEWVRKQDG